VNGYAGELGDWDDAFFQEVVFEKLMVHGSAEKVRTDDMLQQELGAEG
jgi:hypothetical protein